MENNTAKIKDIYHAISIVQGRLKTVSRDKRNTFKDYEYTSLGRFVDSCRKELESVGIATFNMVEFPENRNEHNYNVEVVLRHAESGTQISTKIPILIEKLTMQNFKAAMSSARKIGLVALLQLTDDDDDDAAGISAEIDAKPKFAEKSLLKEVSAEIDRTKADLGKILAYAKVDSLDQLSQDAALNVLKMLRPRATVYSHDVEADVE